MAHVGYLASDVSALFILVIEKEEAQINLKATLADEIGSYFHVMYR